MALDDVGLQVLVAGGVFKVRVDGGVPLGVAGRSVGRRVVHPGLRAPAFVPRAWLIALVLQVRTCKTCSDEENGIVVGGEYGITSALFEVGDLGSHRIVGPRASHRSALHRITLRFLVCPSQTAFLFCRRLCRRATTWQR